MLLILFSRKSILLKIITFFFLIFSFSCARLQKNGIWFNDGLEEKTFTEEVAFEDPLNLIIIPVEINGTIYRFLFDTGAPNVISIELQELYQFKSLGKKAVKDSEGKSNKLKYIKLDKLKIGSITFSNTVAFVTDLKVNPVIDCLDLDGVIGSNLMRFCTWRVDYSNKKITVTNQPELLSYSPNYHEMPFQSNVQHAIKIDFKTPNTKITNLKIDYGSTGSISIPDKIYNELKDKAEFSDPEIEVGFTQSGIFGDFMTDTTESSVIQFGQFGDFMIGKTIIENGGKGLLGTGILKNYIVTMNWPNHTIGFDFDGDEIEFSRNPFGFSPAFFNGNTIVKSVTVNGSAFKAGLIPKMIIQSIDEFKFENLNDFCKYVLRDKKPRDTSLVKATENGVLKTYVLKKMEE